MYLKRVPEEVNHAMVLACHRSYGAKNIIHWPIVIMEKVEEVFLIEYFVWKQVRPTRV